MVVQASGFWAPAVLGPCKQPGKKHPGHREKERKGRGRGSKRFHAIS
jgi:hypothetical protein